MISSWARPGHAPSCTHTFSSHPHVYFSAICVFMVETAYSDQLCPSGTHWASSLCTRETEMALFWEKPVRKIHASGAHLSDTLSSRLACANIFACRYTFHFFFHKRNHLMFKKHRLYLIFGHEQGWVFPDSKFRLHCARRLSNRLQFPKYRNVASPFPCPQSLGHLLGKAPLTLKEGCERMSN